MGALDGGDVDDIVKAALEAGMATAENRRLLLVLLPVEITTHLPDHPRPAQQLRSDVYELLQLEHDGAPALAVWLRNAVSQSAGEEREVFKAKLADLVPDNEADEEPREQGWRWFSTYESIEAGTPTVLAVAETLVASLSYVWLAAAIESWGHFLIAACLAPLALLQPRDSWSGLELFGRLSHPVLSLNRLLGGSLFAALVSLGTIVSLFTWGAASAGWFLAAALGVRLAPALVGVLFAAMLSRLAAVAEHLRWEPGASVRLVPGNLYRVTACTDLVFLPELVPGNRFYGVGTSHLDPLNAFTAKRPAYEPKVDWLTRFLQSRIGQDEVGPRVWRFWQALVASDTRYDRIMHHVGFVLGFAVLWPSWLVGAAMLRLSLKGTAIVWLPILYAYQRFGLGLPIRRRVLEMRAGAFWRLLRWLSWGILACIAAKLLILPAHVDAWNALAWAEQLNVFVMPSELHLWHVAGGANALLYLAAYYLYFEPAPGRMDDGVVKPRTVERVWTGFMLARTALSLVTVGLGIWLTWQTVQANPPSVTWWPW